MKNLYLLGAGGFGREVLAMLFGMQVKYGQQWNIMGFLDDTKDPLKDKACDAKVIGTIEDYFPKNDDVLALCVSDPKGKEKIVNLLKPRNVIFENIVHPKTYIGKYCTIGEGTIIMPNFGMTVNCTIGNFVTLQACCLGHDVNIGDFTTMSALANILGRVNIGKRVFIGANAVLAPSVHIEDDAFVGAGSVVLKKVKQGEKVFGNPAREIGF